MVTSVKHPPTNGHAKAANKVIGRIKEKTRSAEGSMSRRSAGSIMGISLHFIVDNERNALLTHIRGRRHDTRRTWGNVMAKSEL